MSKTYMPSELLNSSYRYELTNNNYLVVHKNTNCFNQYNTTYCDCQRVYTDLDYQISNTYSCSTNYTIDIPYSNFSSDIWYRKDLSNILIIFTILAVFMIILPFKVVARMFGRWLKI